jgi:hypothetical protein
MVRPGWRPNLTIAEAGPRSRIGFLLHRVAGDKRKRLEPGNFLRMAIHAC